MVVRHDGKEGSKIKFEGDVEYLTLHLNSNYEQCVEAQRRQIYFLTKTKTGLFCSFKVYLQDYGYAASHFNLAEFKQHSSNTEVQNYTNI